MMGRKGQSAMEYITTYGWAILVVTIIGIVLWQMGVFDFGSRVTPTYSGFSVLTPSDWAMVKAGAVCTFSVELTNGAGEALNQTRLSTGEVCNVGGGPAGPGFVAAGQKTVCTKVMTGCGDAGHSYEEMLVVEYVRSSDDQAFQSAGVIWGNIEGA